ncbi:MAG TPA: amidophosphoribosyltransferase [Hyphomonadaceae bacterium]|nr:amidophosphoribosyltransferase [Hyphomonadaceae bacterium]HPI47238.1 amidophosphoribosyltransferase [Hyphomonadaceae bacterium]
MASPEVFDEPGLDDDDFGPDSKDGMRHKCGVFGVYGRDDAAVLTALGLHALQHRGQEACGIVTFDGKGGTFRSERHMGLVGDNFNEDSGAISRLPGRMAIGHNRYSTSGRVVHRNIQPIYADLAHGGLAVAHNGNLTNARAIHRELVQNGAIFQSTMDTEVVLQLTARSMRNRIEDRFIDALRQLEGGYAFIALTNDKMMGARDPWGLRPLVLGALEDGSPVLCSETCALDAIGASFVRNIEAGEVVVIDKNGVESLTPFPQGRSSPCVFEYVYFARPDSIMHGQSVYETRRRFGRILASEAHVDADIICPVPDGGNPAALGYAEASSIPFGFGIIRNHYVGRTFIQPTQSGRQRSISRKHAPNRPLLDGKRVVLVDDSIVRGNTSQRIVQMIRDAGASEIHFRVASPPIKHPDFYGIDMPSKEELIASSMSVDQMKRYLKVDSLAFISLPGFYEALGAGKRNDGAPQFADHCFTGDYPTRLVDRDHDMASKEQQLSLLDD